MEKITKKQVATKYRSGSQWHVTYYSPFYQGWITSDPFPYWGACRFLRECKENWDTRRQMYKR